MAVTTEAPLLETARSQIAATVTRAEIANLPLNGRNTLDLALFAPGVSPTNVGGSGQLFPETSAVPGVGLSINSQRNFSNSYLVDGLSANDDAAGLERAVARRGCGRRDAGRHDRRAGGAWAGARRLHQHRDEERHEPAERRRLPLPARRQPQRARTRSRARSCRCTRRSSGSAPAVRSRATGRSTS